MILYHQLYCVVKYKLINRLRERQGYMRLPGEEESGGMGFSVAYMVVGVSVFILIILLAVFKSNDHKSGGSEYLKEMQEKQERRDLFHSASPSSLPVVSPSLSIP